MLMCQPLTSPAHALPPQEAVDSTPALSSLSSDVALVTALFANVSASVDALGLALSYETFHPVRFQLRCTLLAAGKRSSTASRLGGLRSTPGLRPCCLLSPLPLAPTTCKPAHFATPSTLFKHPDILMYPSCPFLFECSTSRCPCRCGLASRHTCAVNC